MLYPIELKALKTGHRIAKPPWQCKHFFWRVRRRTRGNRRLRGLGRILGVGYRRQDWMDDEGEITKSTKGDTEEHEEQWG